jgi:hypothetical protein
VKCVVGLAAGDCAGYALLSQLDALLLQPGHSPEMKADFGDLLNVPSANLRGTAGNLRKRLATYGRQHVGKQDGHIPETVKEVSVSQ